jgi:hypothetical protein
MSDCSDLIGLRYRLGADGTDGEIDCIHLVYKVQARVGIEMPPLNPAWYDCSWRAITRDLLQWGRRVDVPEYDGDMLLMRQQQKAFAITWQTGILYINPELLKVAWCPVSKSTNYHCFRSRKS